MNSFRLFLVARTLSALLLRLLLPTYIRVLLFKFRFLNRYHAALLTLDPSILKVACLGLAHQLLLHRISSSSFGQGLHPLGFRALLLQVVLAAGAVQHMLMVVPTGRTILVIELGPLMRVGLPPIRGLLGMV
jgi:hypothetical protein